MVALLALTAQSDSGLCFGVGNLLRLACALWTHDARFLLRLFARCADRIAAVSFNAKFGLASLAAIKVRNAIAVLGLAVVAHFRAFTIGAGYVSRIANRYTLDCGVAAHYGVAVDLLKGSVFVTAPIAFAIADFDRTQWFGCVGFPVFSTDRTVQTFNST